ncbi:MAG: glycosyltransferase [Pseudomonadota bacterium]
MTEAMRPSLTAARTALAQAVARYDPAQTCGTLKVDSAKVDIVIPVFKGHAETLNTIAHVLAARNTTPMEVVVVNDASPEADLVEDVQCLARDGIITLLSHQENEGFVAATNYGTALHPNRDVIWLNADTEVYDHWIDRLRAVAYEYGRVATVTPLTNNGTICSYPRFNTDNPGKLDVSWAELDADTATLNANVCVKTPTAVGFATYVRRAALNDIGLLDRAAFGLGYGEENDFSQRAILGGWTNLVATNVLVKHYGATSFGDRRSRRVEAALQVLDQRYPAYRSDIQQFLADDPIFPARRRLDVGRLKRLRGRRNILLISHSLGGGTQQHLEEETKRLSGLGWSVFLMSGGISGQPMSVMLTHCRAGPLPTLENVHLDCDEIWALLADLSLEETHIHHLIDFGPNAAAILRERLAKLAISFTFVAHDYFAICPRINLVDSRGMYCGEPGVSACNRCLLKRGSKVGRPDIGAWRADYSQLLEEANSVRVPDKDVAIRLKRYFPSIETVDVVPHENFALPGRQFRKSVERAAPKILVIGAIGPTKGFDSLLALARYIKKRRLGVELSVLGYTRSDPVARAADIHLTGPYRNENALEMIEDLDPDLIWIPSLWPETYSYTLSLALQSGRPIAVFDLGAQASRLRDTGRGRLIPLECAFDPKVLLNELRIAMPAGTAATVELC